MKLNIDTIIFDLGEVLINWDPRNLFRKIFNDEEEMEYFLANVCTGEWNAAQDAGRTWQEGIDLIVPQHPKYEKEINAFWDRWPEMLDGPKQGTVDILTHFYQEQKYELYALTNWSRETFPVALEQFDFLQYFKGILVSGDEMMKKPDPAIYQLLLDRYQINPHQSIFIDDSINNVKAAAAFGIHAIHFQSSKQLRAELETLGVL